MFYDMVRAAEALGWRIEEKAGGALPIRNYDYRFYYNGEGLPPADMCSVSPLDGVYALHQRLRKGAWALDLLAPSPCGPVSVVLRKPVQNREDHSEGVPFFYDTREPKDTPDPASWLAKTLASCSQEVRQKARGSRLSRAWRPLGAGLTPKRWFFALGKGPRERLFMVWAWDSSVVKTSLSLHFGRSNKGPNRPGLERALGVTYEQVVGGKLLTPEQFAAKAKDHNRVIVEFVGQDILLYKLAASGSYYNRGRLQRHARC